MASLVIKDLPDSLHIQLKEQAREHRRSMAQEALTILEQGLRLGKRPRRPPLHRGKVLLTEAMLQEARREGRA